jgi:TRAP-type C4-dicarboxylate transport system substrate-binding protein
MTALAAGALAAALLGACGGGSDKAGGSTAPVVLRLAAADDRPSAGRAIETFADRVARISGGRVRVEIAYRAAGSDEPDIEDRVATMVRQGRYDLGLIGARAWDELGLKSFQALQAPFLITDTALLDKVVTSDVANRMLSTLRTRGVEGIALVPGGLRHPIGAKRPLTTPADLDGARIWVFPSKLSDAVMRALGATPVHVGPEQAGLGFTRGEVDGFEGQFEGAIGGRYITADVSFFPKASTLFANEAAWRALDPGQRDALREAADQAVRQVVGDRLSESRLVRGYCEQGGVMLAGPANVAAFERATRPVYAELERDPETRGYIEEIRALKAASPPSPPPDVPTGCSRPGTPAGGPAAASRDAFNGTYRWRLTADGARRTGLRPEDSDSIGMVGTMTLRDGAWMLSGDDGDNGTFEVRGDRITFDWPRVGYALTFTFRRHRDGTMNLVPVKPMDLGDQFVWASEPWRRVGPPVRETP